MNTRVSVLIPTYNRQAMLWEAVASVAGQDYYPFDITVVNDGGQKPAPCDWAPVTVLNRPHKGCAAAMNAGLKATTGPYVMVVSDDDTVLPCGLATLADALDWADPTVGAVYSLPLYTDAAGNEITTPARLRDYLTANPLVTWETVLRNKLFLHGTATMYRREAIQSVGGWDEKLPTAEEYDLNLRLLKHGWAFKAVDAVTVTYRRHPQGKSQNRFRRRRLRRGVMELIYRRLGLMPTTDRKV